MPRKPRGKRLDFDDSPEAVLRALRRAARKARERSIRTGTPFIVVRDGKIVDLNKVDMEKANGN